MPHATATRGNDIARSLQFQRPALCFAEVLELDEKTNVVHRKTSSGTELCLEKGTSLVYEEGQRPVPHVEEVDSKKRKVLSSITSSGD